MVSPLKGFGYPPAPLSRDERMRLTRDDREAIGAWMYVFNSYAFGVRRPTFDELARLYLRGRDSK